MQELRVHVRRLLQAEASIADALGEQWRPVQLLDISRMGLAFASAERMESGVAHMFNFCLPGSVRRNEVVLKIVHCSEAGAQGGFRIGARFSAIDDDSAAQIARFVSN